jgi:hypothetical protein
VLGSVGHRTSSDVPQRNASACSNVVALWRVSFVPLLEAADEIGEDDFGCSGRNCARALCYLAHRRAGGDAGRGEEWSVEDRCCRRQPARQPVQAREVALRAFLALNAGETVYDTATHEVTGDSIEFLLLRRGQTLPLSDNALQRVIVFAPLSEACFCSAP